MIGWLICLFKGHKRGVRVPSSAAGAGFADFQCPRCKATWTRKVRPATTTSTT